MEKDRGPVGVDITDTEAEGAGMPACRREAASSAVETASVNMRYTAKYTF